MWIYFVDPVLRAPTIGCMLMCLAAALVGVLVFLRKQSLLGESLSHASYPGVVVGVVVASPWITTKNEGLVIAVAVAAGAFVTAWIGLLVIELLQRKVGVRIDAALCFVLSAFFGIGLTIASHVQFTHTTLYLKMLPYLYGQPATMTDVHIVIYGILSLVILLMVILLHKELQAISFDRDFAASLGINVKTIDAVILFLVVLAVVVGIRSVGVVLMSAMLIAPAVAARQWTNNFTMLLIIAALIGLVSGFLGNYLSVEGNRYFSRGDAYWRFALPTGPMIVLVAGVMCILSLLLASERGLLWRKLRALRFRYRCICENILKTLWHFGSENEIALEVVAKYQDISSIYLKFILWRLSSHRWVNNTKPRYYCLTNDGRQWAAKIVRLHRLWELYLADYVGVGVERVHRNAEEMEHIISSEVEEQLTQLLHNPKQDPHDQPIPSKDFVI